MAELEDPDIQHSSSLGAELEGALQQPEVDLDAAELESCSSADGAPCAVLDYPPGMAEQEPCLELPDLHLEDPDNESPTKRGRWILGKNVGGTISRGRSMHEQAQVLIANVVEKLHMLCQSGTRHNDDTSTRRSECGLQAACTTDILGCLLSNDVSCQEAPN